MQPRERATFDAAELAVVLSHYDLGTIESVTEFPRGSHRSPKVGIVCQRGKFLLKRRTLDRRHPDRLRFLHDVHDYLVRQDFPVARLADTRDRKRSFVQLREHVYEMFEFIPGHAFESGVEESREAGALLARLHAGLAGVPEGVLLGAPSGDFHDAHAVRTGLGAIGTRLTSHDSFSGDHAELAGLIQFCLDAYERAADEVNALGFRDWPEQVAHGDWHPGNLLFRQGKPIAVVDYDSMRLSRRVVDAANGALQFSIIAGGDPSDWPDHLDEQRYAAFLGGYTAVIPLDDGERAAVLPLMAEALIAECVAPIAATGSMGRWSGFRMLRMVRRKLTWLRENAVSLSKLYI